MESDATDHLDDRGAARTLGTLAVAGALGVVVNEIVAGVLGTRGTSIVVFACTAVLLTCGVIVFVAPDRLPRHLITVLTPLTIPLIITVNLATHDAGGGALVAFVLPVVYAGAFRTARLTWWTAALAVAGVVTTTTLISPVAQAVTDSVLVTIAIVALASVLRTGRRRQDALVDALERLASIDPLTGLVTRRVLDERTVEFITTRSPGVAERVQRQRTPARPLGAPGLPPITGAPGVGLLVLDIDHFKSVNDAHGPPAGDAVLRTVGAVIRAEVRAGDTVARLGGDEFAVFLPDISRAELEARADTVRAAVAATETVLTGSTSVRVTVSGGAAHGDARPSGPHELYLVADAALYEAKRSGRDRVVVSDVSTRPGVQAEA